VKTNVGRLFPVPLRFDELTEDIEINRRIKSAARTASSMRLRYAPNRGVIHSIFRELSQVQLVYYDRRALPPILSSSPISQDYRLAIRLADLILKHCSIERGSNGIRAFSFLVDMNLLFQDFVTTALRERFQISERSFPGREFGKNLFLDEQNEIRLKPDLSWWQGNRCSFVGDVKYKRSEENADYYQVLAYMTATNLQWGLLVYPNGEAVERTYNVRSEGRQISTETINLNKDPEGILEEIGGVADLIDRRREKSVAFREPR
jgi:5-methylcytosine-specific restriction enzyme subunit McrC